MSTDRKRKSDKPTEGMQAVKRECPEEETGPNTEDGLRYLGLLKEEFVNNPEIYASFIEIMNKFHDRVLDSRGVITSVVTLFKDYPHLALSFNTFMPPGHRLHFLDGEIVAVYPPQHYEVREEVGESSGGEPNVKNGDESEANVESTTEDKEKVEKREENDDDDEAKEEEEVSSTSSQGNSENDEKPE